MTLFYPYLSPGSRGDGCLPRRGTEPGQHQQVPEQSQNHGPRHQAERKIRSAAPAVDREQTRAERRAGTRLNQCGETQRFSTAIPLCADQTGRVTALIGMI